MRNLQTALNTIFGPSQNAALRKVLEEIQFPIRSRLCGSGGLVIKAGSSALVKIGAAIYAVVDGKLITKAANTDMAALSGTVTNAAFNVYVFMVDKAGTLSTAMGTEGASLGLVKFPQTYGKVVIGFVIINPTGTGNFVGGTTALDDGTVVPNAVYVDTVGAFDPVYTQ